MTQFVVQVLLLSFLARATHCFVGKSSTAPTFLLPSRQYQHHPIVTLLQATQGADNNAKNASQISHEEIADYRRGIGRSDSNEDKVDVRTTSYAPPLLLPLRQQGQT
jgi:hypothetical protein